MLTPVPGGVGPMTIAPIVPPHNSQEDTARSLAPEKTARLNSRNVSIDRVEQQGILESYRYQLAQKRNVDYHCILAK